MDNHALYCFLDTNVLVHYMAFDEVDWDYLLGVDSVCLVIAPTVTWELDKLKDDSRNSWRQHRARVLLGKLERFLGSVSPATPVHLRGRTWIMDLAQEPAVDWEEMRLDPKIRDDRILATILRFGSERPALAVQLIARDLGIRRKARHLNIRSIPPPDGLKELERDSAQAKRIRELEQELARYKERLPALELSFLVGQERSKVVHMHADAGPESWPEELTQIEDEIAEKRKELTKAADLTSVFAPDEEIEQYRQAVDRYLENLRVFLAGTRVKERGISCDLQLVLNKAA